MSNMRVFASPLARKLALENGLNLRSISGTGPAQRIIKRDIMEALEAQDTKTITSPSSFQKIVPTNIPPEQTSSSQMAPIYSSSALEKIYADAKPTKIELSKMRKTIAMRLVQAKQTIPHFYLRREARLDRLLKIRSEIKAPLKERHLKVSINDFIIKAVSTALQDVPKANAIWANDHILQFSNSDVGVAVAVDDGLYTPLIRNAEIKSLTRIANEMHLLIQRAKQNTLTPHEYLGGSITISNLGMYGIENFDAIINPPQSAILAVGAGKVKPRYNDEGTLEQATVISLTLSCDHRVIDGVIGAKLLEHIIAYIENPLKALI